MYNTDQKWLFTLFFHISYQNDQQSRQIFSTILKDKVHTYLCTLKINLYENAKQ